ncbi:MAG: beta-ketoacyl synthase N-terminal-like domain-containing protein, partial [Pseudonocardia sp.]
MSAGDVVVTGLGATTPIGGDVASTWDGLLSGRSG